MSASMVKCCQRVLPQFLPNFKGLPLIVQVRTAKKVQTKITKSSMDSGRRRRCNRGIRVYDNAFVHSGQVLVEQYTLKYYPGENVDIGRNNTLRAMCDGKVIMSSEILDPFPDSPLYEAVQKGVVIHKKFFNVYPTPLHSKFRLINEV